jgi:hypothetical protein
MNNKFKRSESSYRTENFMVANEFNEFIYTSDASEKFSFICQKGEQLFFQKYHLL